jgi:ABC transport system ATP-binding/permease protein
MLSHLSIGTLGSLVNINKIIADAIKLPNGSILLRPIDPSPIYDATW